jgi:hypothetical protein
MTRDDIIRMAKEAGWKRVDHPAFPVLLERVERFAALVAASEKELIAQWIESWGNDLTIKDIVEGIRTNGNGVTRPLKYVTRNSGEG